MYRQDDVDMMSYQIRAESFPSSQLSTVPVKTNQEMEGDTETKLAITGQDKSQNCIQVIPKAVYSIKQDVFPATHARTVHLATPKRKHLESQGNV